MRDKKAFILCRRNLNLYKHILNFAFDTAGSMNKTNKDLRKGCMFVNGEIISR